MNPRALTALMKILAKMASKGKRGPKSQLTKNYPNKNQVQQFAKSPEGTPINQLRKNEPIPKNWLGMADDELSMIAKTPADQKKIFDFLESFNNTYRPLMGDGSPTLNAALLGAGLGAGGNLGSALMQGDRSSSGTRGPQPPSR